MDIIWSLKLREAAAKSFEKDIDELAAAEEARFCVDLSPVKVRELCDKILLLPHQGLALLFCRYCFLLSPEDVESLFQVKNAKGRFRFFSRLLSACMGLEETQRISDASLAKACNQAMRIYLRRELKESAGGDWGENSRINSVFQRIGRIAAIAAISFTVLFSTSMAANAQFREKVVTLAMETFEKYSLFELKSTEDPAQQDLRIYQPSYIPEGATLLAVVEQPELQVYDYACGDEHSFSILISREENKIYMDTEHAEITPFERNGMTGYCFQKEGLSGLCFERDGLFFAVFGSIDMDELMKIADSIKIF